MKVVIEVFFFKNLSRKLKFLYKDLTRITGTLHEDQYAFLILFFGPCIFNNEDKNKPTKCTN